MSKKKTIPKAKDIFFHKFDDLVEWVKSYKGDEGYPYEELEYEYGDMLSEMCSWADAGWEEDITRELTEHLKSFIKILRKNKVFKLCVDMSDYIIDEFKKMGRNLYWWNYMIYDEFDWETLEYKGPPRKWKPI